MPAAFRSSLASRATTLLRLAAVGALLATASCVEPETPAAPSQVTPPNGAPRAADLPPDLSGRWIMAPASGPKQYWDLVQKGSALTGTLTVDPTGLPAGEALRPREVLGNITPLGTDWLVQLQSPSGSMRIKGSFDFQYCPSLQGVPDLAACANARRVLGSPSPSPTRTPTPALPSAPPTPSPTASAS